MIPTKQLASIIHVVNFQPRNTSKLVFVVNLNKIIIPFLYYFGFFHLFFGTKLLHLSSIIFAPQNFTPYLTDAGLNFFIDVAGFKNLPRLNLHL